MACSHDTLVYQGGNKPEEHVYLCLDCHKLFCTDLRSYDIAELMAAVDYLKNEIWELKQALKDHE